MIRNPARLPHILATALLLAGTANQPALAKKPKPDFTVAVAAQPAPEPQRSVEVVAMPVPMPLPGQLKPLGKTKPTRKPEFVHTSSARGRVLDANQSARVEPVRDGFINAIQQYAYADGALYQVYAAPGQVTDIALQAGEQLVGAGPVAAGDTVRWIIGDTTSGIGANERVHILVKPTRADLVTNLIINTDRRTYHLELRASPATYMASVSWSYPQDQLIAVRGSLRAAAEAEPIASGIDVTALNFRYQISGDKPAWRPLRAFDDGIRTFIEFPETVVQGDMPPIFVIGVGEEGELVNYRVSGRHLIVDRLFLAAELRMGDKKSEQKVRILRAKAEKRP